MLTPDEIAGKSGGVFKLACSSGLRDSKWSILSALSVQAINTSWKREPFKQFVPIPYRAAFNPAQLIRLKGGLIPRAREDKWFIYYEEPELFFHRSWTGQPVYRLTLAGLADGGATVTEALWLKELAIASKDGADYQARLVDFLIANLLLGPSKPFPLPPGFREAESGVLQHHISSTGYSETPTPKRKPWWRVG